MEELEFRTVRFHGPGERVEDFYAPVGASRAARIDALETELRDYTVRHPPSGYRAALGQPEPVRPAQSSVAARIVAANPPRSYSAKDREEWLAMPKRDRRGFYVVNGTPSGYAAAVARGGV